MLNGTGLLGDPSATQSGVIVPVPDHPAIYYIFTVTNLDIGCPNNGFCYSKVDMNLDDGLGGVVNGEKNVELIAKSTERVTSGVNRQILLVLQLFRFVFICLQHFLLIIMELMMFLSHGQPMMWKLILS
jgi:hypothetical protein